MSKPGEGHDDTMRREAEQIVDALWDHWNPPYRPVIVSAVEGVLRRWATATTRLAAAEEQIKSLYAANEEAQTQRLRESHTNTDLARSNREYMADLAAARRNGICKDVSIKMLQNEVLAARRALAHEVYRNHEHTDACSVCAESDALLAPERPRGSA